jgi:hypothetical protein
MCRINVKNFTEKGAVNYHEDHFEVERVKVHSM